VSSTIGQFIYLGVKSVPGLLKKLPPGVYTSIVMTTTQSCKK